LAEAKKTNCPVVLKLKLLAWAASFLRLEMRLCEEAYPAVYEAQTCLKYFMYWQAFAVNSAREHE
jgi:hypothetical protein